MNKEIQETPLGTPAATGSDGSLAATMQENGSEAATNNFSIPDGYELIRSEDKNNLVSARDRGNNHNQELEDAVTSLMKERDIASFLSSNGEKYPDVSKEDLMIARSEDELDEIAEKVQRRVEDAVQRKLMDVQKAEAPSLSPDEKAAELKKLQKKPGSESFQRYVELQQS